MKQASREAATSPPPWHPATPSYPAVFCASRVAGLSGVGQNEGMKKALLFVLALIAAGCVDPIPRNLDDLSMQGPQYLDPETLEPYSGPVFRMSEDDSTEIVLRVNLRDGRLHGDFEDFEPEDAPDSLGLYQTGTYRNGQREGRFEVFYPSGVFRGRGTYANGQLAEKGTYKDGVVDGQIFFPVVRYYENGQVREKGTY